MAMLPPLFLISDRHQTKGRDLPTILAEVLSVGQVMIQLREKDLDTRPLVSLLQDIRPLIQNRQSPFLINDRVDIALALEMDGVHLRADSLPVKQARQLLGAGKLVGRSTHSIEETIQAEDEGGDFVVLGPIYDTASKRSYGPPLGIQVLEKACHRCQIPIFAIGGINPLRVSEVKQAGAYGVAVVSSILGSECVASATQDFLHALSVDNRE